MTLEYWLLYLTTITIATFVPGPAMLLALGSGMRYGVRRSAPVILGVTLVSVVQASASLLGLGAILTASEEAFHVARWLGAAYLVYVGVQTWRSAGEVSVGDGGLSGPEGASFSRLFVRGALTAVSNPKAIIFFGALYPQFIRPETASPGVFGALTAAVAVVNVICMGVYAFGGRRIVSFFRNPVARRWQPRCLGALFIGFGAGVAVSGK